MPDPLRWHEFTRQAQETDPGDRLVVRTWGSLRPRRDEPGRDEWFWRDVLARLHQTPPGCLRSSFEVKVLPTGLVSYRIEDRELPGRRLAATVGAEQRGGARGQRH